MRASKVITRDHVRDGKTLNWVAAVGMEKKYNNNCDSNNNGIAK